MRATVWSGRNEVSVENVPDPSILNDRDAIVKISSTAICGSDLHLYDGYVPTMKRGDVLGHEFMGEVVEKGKGVGNLEVGDRVVVPFPIACGDCWSCKHGFYAACENSNPNSGLAEKFFGHSTAGIFGYSHITGGYAGGQAEYARACPMPRSARSRSRTTSPTSRSCSCRTSSRPAGSGPTSATSRAAR